jgi:hypothetical protein
MGRERKREPTKFCRACGKQLTRRFYSNRLEDLGAFKRRVYCDRDCMARAYIQQSPTCRDTFHWRARKLRGRYCELCGATSKLHAHHVDGNERNNSPDNIQTLCIHCHIAHHHRARRAGLTVPGRADLPSSQRAEANDTA